jgi:TolB-like protein/class 3 adenylate cyclase
MEPIERKLIAVLCADVKDYSQHMQRDEDGTIRRLKDFRRTFDQTIADHQGRIANTAGDSVVAEFATVKDAVTCAVAAQTALAGKNESLTAQDRLFFRIGIHMGDVIRDGKDILGDGVNIAARIESTAEPGGIALSGSVYDSIKNKLPYRYEFQGEQQLKNITEPVRVYKVVLEEKAAGTAADRPMETSISSAPHSSLLTTQPSTMQTTRNVPVLVGAMTLALVLVLVVIYWLRNVGEEPVSPPTAPTTETVVETTAPVDAPTPASTRLPNSVAVLPFENLSPDPNNAYFADGLHEEVLNHLAKIQALNVIARTTMRRYANTDKSFHQIADELNVETVMEGSVRYANNQIRVTAQLIDPATEAHLWSEAYDHELKDIFAIQSDIAMNVANALKAEFSLADRAAIEQSPTVSPEAYTLYLSASGYQSQQTAEATTLGLERIDRALELAPEFAAGWMLKAWLHNAGRYFYLEHAEVHAEALERSARRALELDPNLGEAHSVLTSLIVDRGKWLPAAEEEKLAIARGSIGLYTLNFATGHIKKAYNQTIKALQTDPLNSTNYFFRFASTDILGDTEEALKLYERGTTLFEVWPGGHYNALVILLGHGKKEQAATLMRTHQANVPIYREMVELYAAPTTALARLRELQFDQAYADHRSQLWIATYAAYFHDPRLALQALRKSTDTNPSNAYLFWTPLFREVRQLDEFKDYMREIGLVDYWKQYGWPDLCQPVVADDFECD